VKGLRPIGPLRNSSLASDVHTQIAAEGEEALPMKPSHETDIVSTSSRTDAIPNYGSRVHGKVASDG
jgi:hypothetical protein